ncbi:hypothetical protein N431DRAFT_532788, partial [Stipitochalara longipes BDJ]
LRFFAALIVGELDLCHLWIYSYFIAWLFCIGSSTNLHHVSRVFICMAIVFMIFLFWIHLLQATIFKACRLDFRGTIFGTLFIIRATSPHIFFAEPMLSQVHLFVSDAPLVDSSPSLSMCRNVSSSCNNSTSFLGSIITCRVFINIIA